MPDSLEYPQVLSEGAFKILVLLESQSILTLRVRCSCHLIPWRGIYQEEFPQVGRPGRETDSRVNSALVPPRLVLQ